MRYKVLIASPFAPATHGFHGGSQVIGRLIEELSQVHSVSVIYLCSINEAAMDESLVRRCEIVEEVTRPMRLTRQLSLLGALARGCPMWVQDWNVPAFGDRLRGLISRWQPDIVQFEFHTMAQYVAEAAGSATVLVEHEPGAAAARDRWQTASGWRRMALYRDMRSWERYERDRLSKFDAIVCFTEADRAEIRRLIADVLTEVIAPCGPAVPEHLNPVTESADTVLFTGNFIHPPNVDAALRLVRCIFPRLKQRHPRAILQLVGDNPPAALRMAAGPGVVVTGRVPEIPPFLEAATVVAAPLRTGGGLRIKVMEALAYGKPLVASPLAVRGLDLSHKRELFLAESDDAFADALSNILSDPLLRRSLSEHARLWALRFLAPGRVSGAFGRIYREILRKQYM
jgi:glycosyltransferase involved in cell wall biosynthesis